MQKVSGQSIRTDSHIQHVVLSWKEKVHIMLILSSIIVAKGINIEKTLVHIIDFANHILVVH